MADFLYGKLNKTIEYLRYEFKSTDQSLNIEITDDYKINFGVNPESFLKILPVKYDSDPKDDNIKHYQLFAKNPETGLFDIPLGEEIVVGAGSSIESNIKSIVINGIPIKGFIDQNTGQLNLDALPASVITDTHVDGEGNEIYIQSVLDGNAGGKVY